MSSRMLGTEVELHVPDELLRFRQPSGVGHQDRIVLLLGDVEVILLLFLSQGRIRMGVKNGLRDVQILPPSWGPVHQGSSLVQSHKFFVWIPVMFASTDIASVKTSNCIITIKNQIFILLKWLKSSSFIKESFKPQKFRFYYWVFECNDIFLM